MKGYKGMTADMTCRGMQYEVGKSYHQKGKIALCKNGFHFCKDLRDVFKFYRLEDNSRYFEVEAVGRVIMNHGKCVTGTLTIVRELTEIEVNRGFYGSGDGHGYERSHNYGCGNGYGYDNGSGNGHSYGYGSGSGYSYGSGNGFGDGHSYGYGIQNVLNFKEG